MQGWPGGYFCSGGLLGLELKVQSGSEVPSLRKSHGFPITSFSSESDFDLKNKFLVAQVRLLHCHHLWAVLGWDLRCVSKLHTHFWRYRGALLSVYLGFFVNKPRFFPLLPGACTPAACSGFPKLTCSTELFPSGQVLWMMCCCSFPEQHVCIYIILAWRNFREKVELFNCKLSHNVKLFPFGFWLWCAVFACSKSARACRAI